MPPANENDPSMAEDTYATRVPSRPAFGEMSPSDPSMAGPAEAREVVGVGLEEFERGLVEQGLMAREAIADFREGLPPGEPATSQAPAKALVRAGRVTRYQASAVYQGMEGPGRSRLASRARPGYGRLSSTPDREESDA